MYITLCRLAYESAHDGDCDGQSDLCHQELHCRGCCPETCIQPPAGACPVFMCAECDVHGSECVADSAAIEQGARDGPTTQETCLQAPLLDDSRPGAFAVRDRCGRVAGAAVFEVD